MIMNYPKITQTAVRVVGTRALLGKLLNNKDEDTIGNWIGGRNNPNIKDDVIPMLIEIIEGGTQDEAEEAKTMLKALLMRDCGHIKRAFLLVDPSFQCVSSV